MLGSQQHFATVHETVATTAAMGIATVHNSRKLHFFCLKGVSRQFVTVAIDEKYFYKPIMAVWNCRSC